MAYSPYLDENGQPLVPGVGDIGAPLRPDYAPQEQAAQTQPVQDQAPQAVDTKPQERRTPTLPQDQVSVAAQSQDDAINQSQVDNAKYNMAELSAKSDTVTRQADAQAEYARGLDQLNKQEMGARAAAEQKNAAEMASYMQSMDALSKQEPNRNRYWENSSSFGKAMWLMSVAATAISNAGHPGIPNSSMELLKGEIEADVKSQNDRIARQMETGKQRGQILQKQADQRLTDVHDDYAKMITRYGALRDAAVTRAQAYPPGTQANLAWMQAATQADSLRTAAAKDKYDKAHASQMQQIGIEAEDRRNKYTQQNENYRASMSQQGEDRRLNYRESQENARHEMDIQKDYDLKSIEMSAADKAAAREQAKQAADEFVVDPDSGISVVMPGTPASGNIFTGNFKPATPAHSAPLRLRKEQQEAFNKEATGYAQSVKGLGQLRDLVADSTAFNRLANNKTELESKKLELAYEYAKEVNGGRVTDKDLDAAKVVVSGMYDGIFDKIVKQGDQKTILSMIDKKKVELNAEAQANLSTRYSTIPMKEGGKIVYNPEQAQKQRAATPNSPETADEQESKAGGTETPLIPKTTDDVRAMRDHAATFGAGPMRELPPDIKSIVNEAETNMSGGDSAHVDVIAKGAIKALDAYSGKVPKSVVDQAKLELQATQEDTAKNNDKIRDAATRAFTDVVAKGKDPGQALKDELEAEGVTNLSAQRLYQINQALKTITDAATKH